MGTVLFVKDGSVERNNFRPEQARSGHSHNCSGLHAASVRHCDWHWLDCHHDSHGDRQVSGPVIDTGDRQWLRLW